MPDKFDNKIEAKADTITDAGSVTSGSTAGIDYVPAHERPDQELYHSHSWWTTYVFSQDAKYIGIQYAFTAIGTGLIGLVLSWMMRLQLAFPGLGILEPSTYYQFITMHGMIMVIYLLTALFLGGFGNLLIPLMCGARDMAFPYVNMVSYWVFLLAVLILLASFFVPGGPTGAGWTLYPPQAITSGTPGSSMGIVLMLISLCVFVAGFTMGGLNYIITMLQSRARGMTLMRLPLTCWGILMGWTALIGEISLEPILLYIAAIFWTLGYDTVYGFQDINDDEIIGVKSTSIKFKENYKIFIGLCYFICVVFLFILGFLEVNKMYYFTFLTFPIMHLFYQMTRLDKNNSNSCLIVFKSNNFFGFLVFLTLIATNI